MPKRILLVEDEAVLALSEAEILKKKGYEVVTAYSGEESIEAVKSDPEISLILMDINLGEGMDGTEAAENILKERDLPVVFLTSHSEKSYVDKAAEIVNYGYVLKSSGEYVLFESIRRAYRLYDHESDERTRLENEVRAKTEFLENITENMFDLVALTDLEGNFVFVGKSHEILGYDLDDLLGTNVMALVHPEDYSYVEEEFIDFLSSNENKKVEYRYKRSDGSYLWFETLGKILTDKNGNPEHILFSTRDISERKQTEKSLVESKEKYRLITENASDLIVQVDTQFKPIYVSPSVTEYFGYMIKDIEGCNVLEFVYPPDRKKIEKMIEEGVNKKEKQFTFTHRVLTKSGEIRWLETNVNHLYDEAGRITGELYVARDVTDIRKLEQVNKERNEYLEAILKATPNAFFTFDSQNKITEWNRGAEKLLHYTKEEVLGCNIDEIVSRQDDIVHEEALSFTKKAVTGESVPPTETLRYTKEGVPVSVIVAGSPIMVDGEFKGVVATYTDISQLKKKEQEVELLLGEKEHLLHEVHHRIKNHMNTISSIISLRTSNIYDDRSRGILEEVQTKMKLMQNIYQSLYIGKNTENVYISTFLAPLLHDIQNAYIDSQSISIHTDIEEIEITAKQSLPVGIIITELLTNSIKYAFQGIDGGEIHVTIHRDKENSGFLFIDVTDNGKGMPPEVKEKGDYGFGLTLVEGYTKQFDGTMSISTGEGTRVRVALDLE